MAAEKWSRLNAPPPPMFLNNKEQSLVKQISAELTERVLPHSVLYYPLDISRSNYHEIYGEALEKTYRSPVHVYAAVEWLGSATTQNEYGIDRLQSINIHFHSRRLTEDQNFYVQEGDVVLYSDNYFEITSVNEPREIFGQNQFKAEITAKAVKCREGYFNGHTYSPTNQL